MNNKLAVEAEHLAIIHPLLSAHLPPGTQIWVYGSRAGARPHSRGSDLDLMIKADAPLAFGVLGMLADDLSESLLPYMVDLHDWHDTSPEFLQRIGPTMVKLPAPEELTIVA